MPRPRAPLARNPSPSYPRPHLGRALLGPSPHPQAYTSQIVALTMMALLLGADSRKKAPKRIAAMRALSRLPDDVRCARARARALPSGFAAAGVCLSGV
mgnify:CR=1 FL=1